MPDVLPSKAVGPDLVLSIVEGCALADRPLTVGELIEYASPMSERQVREAIKGAVWLALINGQGNGFVVPASVRPHFPAGEARKVLLFREHLQKKNPFVQFATFVDLGVAPEVACQRIKVLYQISADVGVLVKLFGSWGRYSGILVDGNQGLTLKPEYHTSGLPFEYVEGLREALESDMKARVFIARKLTDVTLSLVPEPAVDRAVKALRGASGDPRNAVEDIGEFVEDFLRLEAQRRQISVTGTRGIGGVAQILHQSGIFTDEHRDVSTALNTLRIMSAHPLRATTGRRWTFNQDSALEVVLLALTTVRSLQEFSATQNAVF